LRNPEFYALIAQVLPTLLIAVVLELRAIAEIAAVKFVRLAKDARAMHEAGLLSPSKRQTRQTLRPVLHAKRFWRRWIAIWVCTGAVFVVAEGTSLAVVYVGPDTWITWIAAPSSALSAASLVILAVVAPFRTLIQRLREAERLDADSGPAMESMRVHSE